MKSTVKGAEEVRSNYNNRAAALKASLAQVPTTGAKKLKPHTAPTESVGTSDHANMRR